MPPMSRAERAARITQLREQLTAIGEEINRLEREDEGYVAYIGRAQAARQNVLPYPEFARYAVAFEQFEGQWAQAGRPSNWAQLPLLMRLREVLLVPAPAPAAAGARAAPSPAGAAAGATRPAAPTAASTTSGVARPATGPAATAQPAAPATAAPARPNAAGGTAAAAPATAASPAATAAAKAAAGRQAEHAANLAEQHSPILNEVVELSKRAEEEFRLAQLPSGLASVDRAVYLLERVYHAPPALVNRVIKLLDDASKTAQVAEAERQRWDQVRSRAVVLVEGAA
jgi:hypothetical protein